MGIITLSIPVVGQPNSTEDPKIASNFTTVQTLVNGNLDSNNLLAAEADRLGLNYTGVVHRGKSIIATSEVRTNVAYGTLTTPDQVQNVVLPTDGLLFVAYQARWQSSVAGAGRAAIFVGANQLKIADSTGSPIVQEAAINADAAENAPLASCLLGLMSLGVNGTAYTGDVTTGQAIYAGSAGTAASGIAGVCTIFAAAGTYTLSIQFKSASGSVTVDQRKLWVWTKSF